ncbi:hypothetical protein Tco_0287657 [Tanacetum coccineum]
MKKFLINVSINQCKRAKQRAFFDHEGGLIEHYSRLWDYRQQILDMNPVMKEGWSAGCRKVIGLDGCFLKGTVKGELLTTIAGTLKLAGLKRRRKSDRIENRAKAFKFSKDAAGSSADKAWDVDEALAEP